MALSPKRARFASEFLVDCNATQAARRAGYSPKTAKQQGQRLLTSVDVQQAVREAQQARSERTRITADRVLRELAAIAFSRLSDVATWSAAGPRLRPSEELSEDAAAAVQEVSETAAGRLRVKLHDKTRALDMLGRHLGIWEGEGRNRVDDPAEVARQICRFVREADAISGGPEGDALVRAELEKKTGHGGRP
ncbi:MAG: terminase small subunit [Candidatus Latescibacterota bacterium]